MNIIAFLAVAVVIAIGIGIEITDARHKIALIPTILSTPLPATPVHSEDDQ